MDIYKVAWERLIPVHRVSSARDGRPVIGADHAHASSQEEGTTETMLPQLLPHRFRVEHSAYQQNTKAGA